MRRNQRLAARLACAILGLQAFSCASALAMSGDPAIKKLMGTWELGAFESEVPYDTFELTFLPQDKLTFRDKDAKVDGTYRLKDGVAPLQLSFQYEGEAETWNGIAKFVGDELWICIGDANRGPPKGFGGKNGQALLKFKRGG